MRKKEKFLSIDHMVNYYLDLYYDQIKQNPRIRTTSETHIDHIHQIDAVYKTSLQNRYQRDRFNFEENKDKFLNKIDHLTQVFTEANKKADRQASIKKLTQTILGEHKQ